MSNKILNPKKYDLMERTANFGEAAIDFVKKIEKNTVNNSLVSQFIRSATSIGANYMEADCAESKKDFEHKLGIVRKEAKETMHWLRMLARANQDMKEDCRKLFKESQEFVFIFSSIISKSRKK